MFEEFWQYPNNSILKIIYVVSNFQIIFGFSLQVVSVAFVINLLSFLSIGFGLATEVSCYSRA